MGREEGQQLHGTRAETLCVPDALRTERVIERHKNPAKWVQFLLNVPIFPKRSLSSRTESVQICGFLKVTLRMAAWSSPKQASKSSAGVLKSRLLGPPQSF